MTAPKTFISYSWTNAEHEEWVLRLSTELVQSGVDVILDKWDLREGDEANTFMERLVADPDVSKVIIVCDRAYVDKSNDRRGGAGTEAQIISSEIFKTQSQNKFVVVSTELDETGEPVRPTYYTSRVYIPFIEVSKYAENFDQLLRWVFNQPANKKPEIGEKPKYLDETERRVQLATDASIRRAIDAIREEKTNAKALTSDCLELFSKEIEKFRWKDRIDLLGDEVIENISDFLPYRDQFLTLVGTIARFSSGLDYVKEIHKFFELILPYFYRPENVSSWNETQFDNFKFFGNELFLFAVASFLKADRIDFVNELLTKGYYNPNRSNSHLSELDDYSVFSQYLKFLDIRNKGLQLRRISVHADMIKDRSAGSGVSHQEIMQADFILYLRAQVVGVRWWPINLLYSSQFGRGGQPFEMFVRSESSEYFQSFLKLLNLNSKTEFDVLVAQFESGERKAPKWDFEQVSVPHLSNAERLCRRP